jgi:hypothetical protein
MEQEQDFYGVNVAHTFQLTENIFYIGMEVQGLKQEEPEQFVLMFSPTQIEQVFYHYKKLKIEQGV